MVQHGPAVGRQQTNASQLAAVGHGRRQLGQAACRGVHVAVRRFTASPDVAVEEPGDKIARIRAGIQGGEGLRIAALLVAEKALLEGIEHFTEGYGAVLDLENEIVGKVGTR